MKLVIVCLLIVLLFITNSTTADKASNLYAQAYQHYQQKKHKEALGCLGKLLAKKPNHLSGLYLQGLSYLRLGKKDKARQSFKKLHDLQPGGSKAIDCAIQLGGLYSEDEAAWSQAIQLFNEAIIWLRKIVNDPGSDNVQQEKAKKMIARIEKKRQTLDERAKQKICQKQINKGICFLDQRKFQGAIRIFEEFSDCLNTTQKIMYLARAYYEARLYEEGLKKFQEAHDNIADTELKLKIKCGLYLGHCCYRLKKWQRALDYYQQVLKLDPENKAALRGTKSAREQISRAKKTTFWFNQKPMATLSFIGSFFYHPTGDDPPFGPELMTEGQGHYFYILLLYFKNQPIIFF